MKTRTLVVAPHPDDETLGCGGTLLRRKADGGSLAWLIVTGMTEAGGFPVARIAERDREIERVAQMIGFDEVHNLRLPTTQLDTLPFGDVVSKVSSIVTRYQPTELLLPNPSDAHTDHRVSFEAGAACTKWFRHSSVRRVMTYETPSETEFGLESSFQPNVFVDIGDHLEKKLDVMTVYASEVGAFPFPRSIEAIRALAAVRGAASGFKAAEAFQLLRERQ